MTDTCYTANKLNAEQIVYLCFLIEINNNNIILHALLIKIIITI